MKKIVVPTDFSENAIVAGKIAVSLAQQLGACLVFVHAFQFLRSGFQGDIGKLLAEEEANDLAYNEMTDYIRKLDIPAEVVYQTVLSTKPLMSLLGTYELDAEVVLVVMGTQGASGFNYRFLGSNSFDIARNLKLPLLIVPKQAKTDIGLSGITFFTDFQVHDIRSIQGVKSIVESLALRVRVVHLQSDGLFSKKDNELRMDNLVFEFQTSFPNFRFEGMIEDLPDNGIGVDAVLQDYPADWVVLTMNHHSFLDRLMDRSLAKKIILNPTNPIFINNRNLN